MPPKLITIAKIGAPHGVRGDLKLHAFVDNLDLLLKQKQMTLIQNHKTELLTDFKIRPLGDDLLIHLKDIDDRDVARRYTHAELAVPRDALPTPEEGEFYWADLEGLKVFNTSGAELGVVDYLMATGANDIIVIQHQGKEILVPYLPSVVKTVDLAAGKIVVEWDEDF